MEPIKIFTDTYPSFGSFDSEALRRLVGQIDSPVPRILEIGSWLGMGSTRVLIEALKPRGGILYCVDTFEGSPGVVRHREIANEFDVLATFRHNVSLSGGNDLAKILCMTSTDAAALIAPRSLDMVFIDGDHSYAQTNNDLSLWESKIHSGGILCGHDCESRLNDENRSLILLNKNVDAISAKGHFRHHHPGVILAVHEKFGTRAHLWAEENILLPDGSIGRATLWDTTI
jgi:hypothetical protein